MTDGGETTETRDTLERRRRTGPLGATTTPALAGLVAVNLLPLAGVLLLGWNLGTLLVLYWLESAVVGAFNVPKVLYAHGTETAESRRKAAGSKLNGQTVTLPDAPETVPDEPTMRPENRPVARFFVGHYGGFWLVHGLFVLIIPIFAGGGTVTLAAVPTLALATGAAVVSHGISFRSNYLRDGEWRTVSPGQRMNAPYDRVIVLHLTVVFGAFVVGFVGAPAGALVVMVVVKTALDVRGHLREHRREKPTTGATAG